jgi:tRNA-2-methylthio-N6-dimethylallyladenosine synthase
VPGVQTGAVAIFGLRLGPTLLEQARHVSLVVGPDGYRALPQLLEGARTGERVTATSFDLEEHYEDFAPRRFDKVKAWIPVQRGCDYRCTYCIVPTTRGSERSRRLEEVVRETREVVASGMSEVVLLGQTVNSYTDGTHDFADLLRAVGTVPGIRRVRYTSPHPNDFSDRVIAAMAEVPTVCEHVHLPMQSGSTRMLKRMLRRYSRDGYMACVDRIRRAVPGVSLTTDIIVGFPGETDDEFDETLSAVREVGFADAYTFIFSPRDGTPATRMPAELSVPPAVASERLQRLVETVRAMSRQRNMGLLGTRHEVLVEREAKRGEAMLMTRTRDFKTVLVPGDATMLGAYLTVELTGTTGSTFTGSVVRERQPLPMAG